MYISSSFSSLYTELIIILILSLPFYYLPLPSLSFSFYPPPPLPQPYPQERLQAVAQESLQMERDQLEREVRRLHRDVKEWKVTTESFVVTLSQAVSSFSLVAGLTPCRKTGTGREPGYEGIKNTTIILGETYTTDTLIKCGW